MRYLEDKRRCPHCGGDLHEQPYLMARAATENVLSWATIAWVFVLVLLLGVLAGVHG